MVKQSPERPPLLTVAWESAPLLVGELRRAGSAVHHGATSRRPMPDGVRLTRLPGGGDGDLAVFTLTDPADRATADLLRAAGDAWRSALGDRTVLLAEPRSFCAGVERAVAIVEEALERYPHPVYVRKQIVHNVHVVRDLSARGAVFVEELDEVPSGATVVFSAHGVAPAVRADAGRRGLNVIDATCPLVTKVHSEVRRYARRGDRVFLVGHPGHEESEGTLGEAPDRTVLVTTPQDVAALPDLDGESASFALQTTLAMDEADEVVAALRERFPSIQGPGSDDICYATTNRQRSVRAVAAEADTVFVVGSRNSSNSVRLVEVARRAGSRARLVEDAVDVPLADLAGARVVGLTAGASAAPALVEEIVRALRGLGAVRTETRQVAVETVTFALPKELTR
jgi:4-hydroxy-3-methylbut-2-enyl diphosphate reductase